MSRSHPRYSAPLAVAALVQIALAQAQPTNAQSSEDLQRQIDALKAEINRLEEKIEEKETREKADRSEALKVEAKGAPRFSGEGFENFKIRGRIQSDIGQVGDPDEIGTIEAGQFVPDRGLGTTSELRRARIGVEGQIQDWKYKIEADFATGESDVADAYIQYKGFQGTSITVGHQKTPASMSEQTSTRFIKFMERGAFTDAFGLTREIGATVKLGGETWQWSSGAYLDGGLSGDDEDSGYILGSRAHYAAIGEDGFAHIGASVEFRDNGAQENRFRQRPFLHSTDTRLVNTGDLPVQDSVFFGGELAGTYGPFNFSGEYGAVSADLAATQTASAGDAFFQGGFLHLGYFLTGEQRGYDAGAGKWVRTAPAKPLGGGGFGAFEINAGVDWIDLDDAGDGVLGGTQASFAAGLTWIPIAHVRVLANYSHTRIDNSPTHVELSPGGFDRDIELNTFGLRAQVDW